MIHHGDVRDILPTLPDQSVQCVVTSPPYWALRDYGVEGQIGLEATPEVYLQTLVGVFREVRRVLRDDGTLWLNMGDTYNSRLNGSHGGWNGSSEQPQRVATSGAAVTPRADVKQKNLLGMPWRLAFALQADGWYLRSDIIWAKGLSFCDSYSGSVMPESVTDRPTKAHEYLFLLAKGCSYYYDAEAVREPGHEQGASRFGGKGGFSDSDVTTTGRNLRDVWAINPQPFAEAHFATFPMALVEPCIKAGSRKGDTVMDPFAGSGTVGIVAQRYGRAFVGIELKDTYAEMARAQVDGPLFAQESR